MPPVLLQLSKNLRSETSEILPVQQSSSLCRVSTVKRCLKCKTQYLKLIYMGTVSWREERYLTVASLQSLVSSNKLENLSTQFYGVSVKLCLHTRSQIRFCMPQKARVHVPGVPGCFDGTWQWIRPVFLFPRHQLAFLWRCLYLFTMWLNAFMIHSSSGKTAATVDFVSFVTISACFCLAGRRFCPWTKLRENDGYLLHLIIGNLLL